MQYLINLCAISAISNITKKIFFWILHKYCWNEKATTISIYILLYKENNEIVNIYRVKNQIHTIISAITCHNHLNWLIKMNNLT